MGYGYFTEPENTMNAAPATLRSLFLSERILPGALLTGPLKADRNATRETVSAVLAVLGLTGTVVAEGPHGAVYIPSGDDIVRWAPYAAEWDRSGYTRSMCFEARVKEEIVKLLPPWVRVSNAGFTFRARVTA